MKKFTRVAIATFLLLQMMILGANSSLADTSSTPGLTKMGTRAFSDLTRCISTKQKLDVYYLVDESNSLPMTDPESARAGILAASLKELAGFDSSITVNYGVGFFGSSFDPWKNFQTVNPSNIDAAASAFASEVKSRNRQNETNWLAGLNGAADILYKHESTSHACQALIWLTDGGLWLAKKGSSSEIDQPAVDSAEGTLCDNTFLNLRKNNVSVFGVLLQNTKALENIYKNNPTYYAQNDKGVALMRPLVEGDGSTLPGQQSTSCGGEVLPNYSAGALLIAKDPIALALQFLILGGQTRGGIPSDLSPGNPTTFDVEKGVRKFQILTTSKHWTLTSPVGIQYSDGSTDLDVQNQNGVQQITVNGASLKLGRWKFNFDQSGAIVNKLLLYSGLIIQLDPGQYIGGKKTYISGQVVVDGSKEVAKLSDYRTHDFEIDQVTSTGSSLKINNVKIDNSGVFSAPFDLTSNQKNLEIRITLRISTVSGKNLADVSTSKFLTILLPSNYPTIDSPILLSPINGPKGVGNGPLTVHGPLSGAGKVCLSGNTPFGISIKRDATNRSEKYSWRVSGIDSDGCVAINQGEIRQLQIEGSNPVIADAHVIAEIPLKFFSSSADGSISLAAPIDFETTIIRAGRGFVKIFLFLFGVGLPLFLLYLLNVKTSKLIFGIGIQRATYKVKIDSISGISSIGGGHINPTADDFKLIPQQPDVPNYQDPIGLMRTRVSFLPLKAPWYEIEALPGSRIVTLHPGSSAAATNKNKRFASGQINKIPADIGKFWAIEVKESDLQSAQSVSSVPGTLVIFKRNNPRATTQHLDRVAEVIATAGIWNRLAEIRQTPIHQSKAQKEKKVKNLGKRKTRKQGESSDVASSNSNSVPTNGSTPPPLPGRPPTQPPQLPHHGVDPK